MPKITIIGTGVGDERLLNEYAKTVILKSNKILLTKETPYIQKLNENTEVLKISEMESYLENNTEDVCIAVSGDSGFYSISSIITNKFKNFEIETINGINSMQYFASKLNKPYSSWISLSLHGRDISPLYGMVSYNSQVFILTDKVNTVQEICKSLCQKGLSFVNVYVGENLSLENENITAGKTAEELSKCQFSNLSVMLIENPNYANSFSPIRDNEFTRSEVPMTKECVRWTIINYLDIKPTDVILDIGAGTGSVSIEIARKANKSVVFAIECKSDAVKLINENKIKHGAYNLEVISDKAPIDNLKLHADKAYIGGSGGNLKTIVAWLISLNPKIKIAASFICIENLTELIQVFDSINYKYEFCCINVSSNKPIKNKNLMIANNPVYVIIGECQNE